jgi:hypothetical protein
VSCGVRWGGLDAVALGLRVLVLAPGWTYGAVERFIEGVALLPRRPRGAVAALEAVELPQRTRAFLKVGRRRQFQLELALHHSGGLRAALQPMESAPDFLCPRVEGLRRRLRKAADEASLGRTIPTLEVRTEVGEHRGVFTSTQRGRYGKLSVHCR